MADGGDLPAGMIEEALPEKDLRSERAKALRDEAHRLRIRTIHSFCTWLLQIFPVEAGLDPSFQVDADDRAVESTVHEVVDREARRALSAEPDPAWLTLAADGIGPRELAEALVHLVKQGVPAERLEEDPCADELVAETIAELSRVLEAFWKAEGGRLDGIRGVPAASRTRDELEQLTGTLRRAGVQASAALEGARSVASTTLTRLRAWEAGTLGQREKTAIGDAAPAVTVAAGRLLAVLRDLRSLQPDKLRTAAAVLAPLLAAVQSRLRAQGVMTFQALLDKARELLRKHRWVRDQVRREMRQLLVDEFQDTDRLQCDVVRMLALGGKVEGRPGLFIVGDPKQCIYGWRDADLEAYDGFKDEVKAAGGQRLVLSVNYRSVPAILTEVERIVKPVMKEAKGLQPGFERLVPCEELREATGFNQEPRAPVEIWGSWPRRSEGEGLDTKPSRPKATEVEALALARDLVEVHDSGVPWSQMAVLLRTTGDIDVVLEALRAAGVPYSVTREREYYRSREVVEAAALVRCVLDPADQLALLTVLRSDVVGTPDAALIPLWQNRFAEAMLELGGGDERGVAKLVKVIRKAALEVPGDVPGIERLAGWTHALEAAVEAVALLRRSLASEPGDVFVERLRTLWLAETTAAARYLGRHRRARLERFFAEVEETLATAKSPAEVVRVLRQAVEQGRESREPVASEATTDSVRVMTIHGAKGLDFEHVYLMQLHKGTWSRGGVGTEVLRQGPNIEYALFGWPTPGFGRARRWQERVGRAELVRLLYVATTRAKNRLVLAGCWPEEVRKLSGEKVTEMIHLVVQRGGGGEFAEQARAETPRRLDGDKVQWVLPALALPAIGETGPRQTGQGSPLKTVSVHAEVLARARVEAGARMERGFSRAASEEAHRVLEREERAEQVEAGEAASGRTVAMTVGTAVHFLLEQLDLEGDLVEQVSSSREHLMADLEADLGPDRLEAAGERLDELLQGLRRGHCLGRLQDLGENVIARELSLLLPPQGDDDAVGFVAGSADLVYRDPSTGELVVADYKTDRVTDLAAAQERAEVYASQVGLYARGLQEALGLDSLPVGELWFLHADQTIRLERQNV
jgi:ATP-dependent helicase/nuclease subunit A